MHKDETFYLIKINQDHLQWLGQQKQKSQQTIKGTKFAQAVCIISIGVASTTICINGFDNSLSMFLQAANIPLAAFLFALNQSIKKQYKQRINELNTEIKNTKIKIQEMQSQQNRR